MKLKHYISIVLVSLGISCAGASGVPNIEDPKNLPATAVLSLHGDVEFTPDERLAIQKASDTWSLQTAGQARVDVVYDLDFSRDDVEEFVTKSGWYTLARIDKAHESRGDDKSPNTMGNATKGGIHSGYRVGINIWVDRIHEFYGTDFDRALHQVLVHEFGHGLGCEHITTPTAIMAPKVLLREHICLTKPDLTEFCRHNTCKEPLYPCQ